MRWSGIPRLVVGFGQLLCLTATGYAGGDGTSFRRIATFRVFENTSEDVRTVAETVAAADAGQLLVYTDSETNNIGFVDISDPADPRAAGVVPVTGEPTSVAVHGPYALACVNTSVDYVNTSGHLAVIDIHTRRIVRTIPLGGQPDAIAVSPDGQYAAIAIENERNENLDDGTPTQAPPGFVVIVDLIGRPSQWVTRTVDLLGIPDQFPADPEPEFVDINEANVAAITLQENNHIVLIRLSDGSIVHDFPAGTVDLTDVDTTNNGVVEQTGTLTAVRREPDAIAWTSRSTFATADEGDLFGGSRGFTTWDVWGDPLFEAGSTIEHMVARFGHQPEGRSENNGNEPEGVEFGRYGDEHLLFVGSERASVVLVYELVGSPIPANMQPRFRQVLPAGVGPEGLLAIPSRDLFVVANEVDYRDGKIRSSIMIYELGDRSTYPTLRSVDRGERNTPIPWGALSGLAAHPTEAGKVYTVHDDFYRKSRIYEVDITTEPAVIGAELELRDSNHVLIDAFNKLKTQLPDAADFNPEETVAPDYSVNLDPEGIAVGPDGSLYIASEGKGSLPSDAARPGDRPFKRPNLIVQVGSDGSIEQVITLPLELTKRQSDSGFGGLAVTEDFIYAVFQRPWQHAGDPADRARLGRYDRSSGTWSFAHYPLDAATSPNGGWVGLSDLTHLGDDRFAVIERDNQGGPDARIKRVYSFSLADVTFLENASGPRFDVVKKVLVSDLIVGGAFAHAGGFLPEKLEGLTVVADGTALLVNDNNGVSGTSGETQLVRLPRLFDLDAGRGRSAKTTADRPLAISLLVFWR